MYDITNKIKDTANRINGFEGLREFPSINDISANIISDSTSKSQEKFSDRDPDSTSPRNLLANALEGTVSNDVERKKLAEYKKKIALITAEEEKLTELRRQIKELSFSKGKRDSEKLKQLREEATKTANRINTYDRQLLSLESTTALKNVLEREKKKAAERQKKKDAEILADYRKRAGYHREISRVSQEGYGERTPNRDAKQDYFLVEGIPKVSIGQIPDAIEAFFWQSLKIFEIYMSLH